MKKIFVLAQNTYIEIIRDRILYGLIVFALLLIGLSLALGQLSFTEQGRIALDFGLVGIQLSSVVLAIFIGSTLVSKEIEKQTILTILSRPIGRGIFLIGKFFGLLAVIFTIMVGLLAIVLLVARIVEVETNFSILWAMWGILLESIILLGITLLFGVMIRPFLTVTCTVGIFLIGHWIPSLVFFAEKSESESFRMFGLFISKVLPNLERFNWRSSVTYLEVVPLTEIVSATVYALGWVLILLAFTNIIFRRRDFV